MPKTKSLCTPVPVQPAYSIAQFCCQHGISRSLFYKLLQEGHAPRIMKAGKRTREMAAQYGNDHADKGGRVMGTERNVRVLSHRTRSGKQISPTPHAGGMSWEEKVAVLKRQGKLSGELADLFPQWEAWQIQAALDQVESVLKREVVMGEAERVATVLWIAQTYVYEEFKMAPRLFVTSVGPNSGKTTLLSLIAQISSGGMKLNKASEAYLGRLKDTKGPRLTVALDQLDNALARATSTGPMIDRLISGADRGSQQGLVEKRGDGSLTTTELDLFYPMALGKIGVLPSIRREFDRVDHPRIVPVVRGRNHRMNRCELFTCWTVVHDGNGQHHNGHFRGVFLRLPPNKFLWIPPDLSPVSIRLALLLSQSRIARGEFTPAVGKFAPAAGAFRKCIPCGVVGRPRCVFFAIRLVIEAFLHLTSGFHARVTPGGMECAA
jgi:hypothetical protein